jgi:hypothetical protein
MRFFGLFADKEQNRIHYSADLDRQQNFGSEPVLWIRLGFNARDLMTKN